MFAKNRCRVASFGLRCLRLSERFSKKHVFSERMHSEVRRYLQFQMEDWNEHPNHVEMSTHRALCFILRTLNFELSEQFTWLQLSLASFHRSKHKAVVHLPSSPHGTRRRIQAWGPSTGAIPRRQAEALHRRALVGREAQLGENHPETLESMNNLAVLLWRLAEVGLRSSGWEVTFLDVSPRVIILFGQGLRRVFFLQFPHIVLVYYATVFFSWRTNTN